MNTISVGDSEHLQKSLKCEECNRLLSGPPVYYFKNLGSVCGRCFEEVKTTHQDFFRVQIYEDVAQCITFPCPYTKFGCNEQLQFGKVEEHKGNCPVKCLKCPLYYTTIFKQIERCSWIGGITTLQNHIEQVHKQHIIDLPQMVWPDNQKNTIMFTYVGSKLVTIVIKFIGNKCYTLLMMNGQKEGACHRYQLEFFDEKKRHSLILRKNEVETIGDMLNNFNKDEKMLEINLKKIRTVLRHPKQIMAKFGIAKKSKKEIAFINGSGLKSLPQSSKEVKIDEDLMSELECPVCKDYMMPPIFICESGHSICNVCKPQVVSCPSCRKPIIGARNFTLEKLTMKVNYPCNNRCVGCTFAAPCDQIKEHMKNCIYAAIPCILGCDWAGLHADMLDHLMKKHENNFFNQNTAVMRDLKSKEMESTYALYVHGEYFRLFVKHHLEQGPIKFNVLNTKNSKYLYQLDIIDQSSLGLKLSISKLCQPFTGLPGSTFSNCLDIPYKLVQPFLLENRNFSYKISIIKVPESV